MRRPARPDPVAAFEAETRADLRQRRWLTLHVLLLAALCTAGCWGLSAGLRALGVHSLLWRPVLAIALTWPLYLGLMALWARWLVSRDETDLGDLPDVSDAVLDLGEAALRGVARAARPPLSGQGGDFAGGGAQASFGDEGSALGELGGQALSGAAEALGDADEGAAVVVPLLVVVAVGLALASALGFVVFGLFGVDVLLGMAVEVAFASLGGALAWRARREGWLAHGLRRTAAPMAGLLASVAAAGALLQAWVPQAATWPQALHLLFGA